MYDEELVVLASVAAHVPPRRDHRVRDRVQMWLTHDITCAMSQNTLELHPEKRDCQRASRNRHAPLWPITGMISGKPNTSKSGPDAFLDAIS